ncbi:hypothetical protein HDU79_005948 [Rhizoclosmatium sp. JEL0117]|nr:hypothetical protein HDU79_005948 [Rhizoclosmatium sp. JEL0117]
MGLQPVEGGTTSVRPTSADRIQFHVGNTRNSGDGRQWSVGSLGSVGEGQESQFRLGPSVIPQPPPQPQQQPTKIITRGEGSSLNVLADVMLKDGSRLSNPSTPDLEAGQSPPPPPNIYNHVLTVPPVHQRGDIGRGSRAKAHLEVDAPGRPHHCIYHGLSREEALEIHGVVMKEVCYARFRRRQEMLRHVRSVHGGAGDKVWVCPGGERGLCNRRFARADALRRHLESIRCREEKDGCSYGMSDEEIGRLVRAAKE